MFRSTLFGLFAAVAAFAAAPSVAQVTEIDPNNAGRYDARPPAEAPVQSNEWFNTGETQEVDPPTESAPADPVFSPEAPAEQRLTPPDATGLERDDIFSAAEGVFGRGAQGLAGMIENILREQGEPIAYIAGQEAGGAFVLGVRYGSGMMRHRIEGDRPVYWTGPSLGFDFGADASKVFVLVYNLHDTQDLFTRYPGAEGNAYVLGGFTAQYLRRGDVVLIPIRLGVGLRLGVNAGYMRFSERNRWLPF